jgi:tetratricopeptide (TPR) repeat protein
MHGPLKQLFNEAHLQHERLQKCIRYLKASEALASFWACNFVAHYMRSTKIDPKVEREIRALASPAFGTFVSILRLGKTRLPEVQAPEFRAYVGVVHVLTDKPSLNHALQLTRKLTDLPPLQKKAETIDLFETLMTLRNKGIGHGGVPSEETALAVEELGRTIDPNAAQIKFPKMLSVQETRTDPERRGDFIQLGYYFDGEEEHPWRTATKSEDLLPIKQLHFFDGGGHPIPATPFVQIDKGTHWFLQKYRRGGNSHFTDYRSETHKTDPYWDEYVARFLDERFERGGQVAVQVSTTGVYHDLPPEIDAYKAFVGRQNELEILHTRLRPERQIPIIAIGGLGGAGKTALGRSFVQSIADAREQDRSFDYLVWVSAKTTTLQESVESVTPGFEDIEDVLDEVARVAESLELIYQRPFEKKKSAILDLLSSARFLLVIDNFETVKKKDALWDFLTEVPAPSKVLVTSRETFSEGCWTLALKELTDSEALEVFSNECKWLEVDPAPIVNNDKNKTALLQSTGGVPLALKYVAILLDRGKMLSEALQGLDPSRGPIADFCFRGTFNALDKVEKTVWVAMGIFQRPVSQGELVQITELSELEVSRALQVLRKYTIINRDLGQDGHEVFWCLPLTLEFAKRQLDSWPGTSEMTHRYKQFRALVKKAGITDTGVRTLKEAPVIHPRLLARELSRAALAKYRTGGHGEALELVENAVRLDPGEVSVWEAKAEIERGEYQYEAAFDAYKRVIELSPYNLPALREITLIAKNLELWTTAIEYGRRVTQLPGATKKDWHILGHMYYRKAQIEQQRGDPKKAEEAFLVAIDSFKSALINNSQTSADKKHNAMVCDTMARAYMRVRMFDEARDTVIEGLVEDPYNSMLLDLQMQLLGRTDR